MNDPSVSEQAKQSTVTKMKQMKLYGIRNEFKTAVEIRKTDHYTLDQFVSMLIVPNGMKGTIVVVHTV
ncbi:hypothetical protein ACNQGP_08495 [Flavobacterium sp. GT2N3]|uniref:hypothetical protein n=1 Tax=unclassified Flavobacterium TaxID=196869 RepID=UPI003AB0F6C0